MTNGDKNPLSIYAAIFGLLAVVITVSGAWMANSMIPVTTNVEVLKKNQLNMRKHLDEQVKALRAELDRNTTLMNRMRDSIRDNQIRINDLKRLYGDDTGYAR